MRLELALDRGGLLVADVEVGVRGAGERVRRRCDEPGLVGRHRLELGDDAPDRGRVAGDGSGAIGAGLGATAGSGGVLDPKNRSNMRLLYQRSYAGWSGPTATNVPRHVAVMMPSTATSASTTTRSPLGLDRPGAQLDGPVDRRRTSQADRVVGGHAAGRTGEAALAHQRIAAVQFAWQSSSVPMIAAVEHVVEGGVVGQRLPLGPQLTVAPVASRGSRCAGPARSPGPQPKHRESGL